MSPGEFVIELLDKLAWPTGIIVLVLLLRKEMAGLLQNLRSLKYKDLTLEFGQKLEGAKEAAEKAGLPSIFSEMTQEKMEYYKELVEIFPALLFLSLGSNYSTLFVQQLEKLYKEKKIPRCGCF